MISQLKSRSDTRASVRILMVVRGGALERARALDLGRMMSSRSRSKEWSCRAGAPTVRSGSRKKTEDDVEVRGEREQIAVINMNRC